jgi:XTP/dITP diphosphohydrolase
MTRPTLLFVTGNKDKFTEAERILKRVGFTIEQYPERPVEIQSTSLEEIARHSCQQALIHTDQPLFVEDAGLFIYHYNGFPGPYSSYVLHTLGNPGVLKLMEGVKNREAVFRSVVAYGAPDHDIVCFEGRTKGIIAQRIRGTRWGFDPIFIPTEGDGSTYSEMPTEMKNLLSHRAKALAKFSQWLLENE